MLALETQQTISINSTDVAVWKDDQQINKFYFLSQNPQFRIDNNQPVFKFLKYRSPIDREDGPKGGFCVFDIELSITETEKEQLEVQLLEQVQNDLQKRAQELENLVLTYRQDRDNPQGEWRELARRLGVTPVQVKGFDAQYEGDRAVFVQPITEIEFGAISYTRGSVAINLQDLQSVGIERVLAPAAPALFGDNVATFTAEFTPEGARLFEQALQGKGGTVSITYNLWFSAMLPPVEVIVSFDADKFKSFHQERDATIGTAWGTQQNETITEQFRQSESGTVEVILRQTFDDPDVEEEIKTRLRDWGEQKLEDAIARQIEPDFGSVGNRFNTDGGSFLRGVDRLDTVQSLTSFRDVYKESSAVEYNLSPQGTLPNITTLTDEEGNLLVPEEELGNYFQEVDLDDDFFKILEIWVKVNADFEGLGLFDVQVQLEYADSAPKEFSFDGNDSGAKQYRAFLAKDVNDELIYNYQYYYEINYRGKSQKFSSNTPITTNETILTIGVDDVGMLLVNGYAQGVDFRYIDRAQVSIRYNDSERNISVNERQFIVDANNREFEIKEPIFVPRDQPFEYKVRYFMADGSEFEEDWQPHQAREFYLNDPFTATLDYSIQAVGSFSRIDAIFLDLEYTETGTEYRQTQKVTFDSSNRRFDWKIPAVNSDQRQMTYSGFIQYENGDTEEIPRQSTQDTTIRVGNIREDLLEVNVATDDINFETRVRSAKVTLRYEDSQNGVSQKDSFSFRDEDDEDWEVDLKDKDFRKYEWQAVVTMYEKRFGDRGKIYLPGPTDADWGVEDTTQFYLADYLPSDEELAEANDLLLVKISAEDINWGEDDEDEVESITVYLEYGKTKEKFRIDEDSVDEDGAVSLFLAPLERDGIEAIRRYNWRVEFKTGEGKRYYPSDDKDEFALSEDRELFLTDIFDEILSS